MSEQTTVAKKRDNKIKSIRMTAKTHSRLYEHMQFGWTYEDLINMLLDKHEAEIKRISDKNV